MDEAERSAWLRRNYSDNIELEVLRQRIEKQLEDHAILLECIEKEIKRRKDEENLHDVNSEKWRKNIAAITSLAEVSEITKILR